MNVPEYVGKAGRYLSEHPVSTTTSAGTVASLGFAVYGLAGGNFYLTFGGGMGILAGIAATYGVRRGEEILNRFK